MRLRNINILKTGTAMIKLVKVTVEGNIQVLNVMPSLTGIKYSL